MVQYDDDEDHDVLLKGSKKEWEAAEQQSS
jgi:hypothetical protein